MKNPEPQSRISFMWLLILSPAFLAQMCVFPLFVCVCVRRRLPLCAPVFILLPSPLVTCSHTCHYLDYKARMFFWYHATMSRVQRAIRVKWKLFVWAPIKRLKSCIPWVSGSWSLRSFRHDAAASGIPGMCSPSLIPSGRARWCVKRHECATFLSWVRAEVCVVKIRNGRREGNYHAGVTCSADDDSGSWRYVELRNRNKLYCG